MFKTYKHYFIYIGLSVLMILFSTYVNKMIFYLINFENFLFNRFDVLFSASAAGILLHNVFIAVLCPFVLTGVPALIYYVWKRKIMPYFLEATWLVWFILLIARALME